MPTDSRNKTISFRLTEDEYERFRVLCSEQNVGNVSELARVGMNLLFHHPDRS